MKRIGFLFEKAFTPEALLAAYKTASRHKHGTRACFQFETHLSRNLDALHDELHGGTYKPLPYFSFLVFEPKRRTIFAPAFRDLVVQHAIYAVVGPIFERSFIGQSFACRIGYGTHKAADYAQEALRASPRGSYTLKLDIRKFFYRIDRTILRGLIERKIKDRRFIDLMMQFADHGEPVGIPIGNLLSQLYALIFLNPVDHFVKRVLKTRLYCRYVDDFILFGLSHETLLSHKARIVTSLAEMRLELSRFTLAQAKRGVNFVGYRTWRSKRFIRKHSLYVFRRSVKRGDLEGVVSSLGHALRTCSLAHMLRLLKEKNDALYLRLPEGFLRRRHLLPQAAC